MPLTPKLDISFYGDSAILVSYNMGRYSEAIYETVTNLADTLTTDPIWTNIIPAYDSLMVTFNPTRLSLADAKAKVEAALAQSQIRDKPAKKEPIDIPVFYGGENGPDMATICQSASLNEEQVIKRHSQIIYRVCMMGFIPGFAFLSKTDKALHHRRHATPREKVAPGSVGIANWQTGIYGLESPGGWQIIGRTPLTLFDAKRDNPFLLNAGDWVRFVPEGNA
jgi:KipI family sensor histidine kinase inhibitor